jgi:hypothetical protein
MGIRAGAQVNIGHGQPQFLEKDLGYVRILMLPGVNQKLRNTVPPQL